MIKLTAISDRTEKLIGNDGVSALNKASVLIVGLGGVGGAAFEMLVRAGVGNITAVDGDCFEESNLNRQLLSSLSVLGVNKAHAAVLRAAEIAPKCNVTEFNEHYTPQSSDRIFAYKYDYVLDCIDSVADKIHLICRCNAENVKIISAMGAGNRLKPDFKITDIYSTCGDGLARAMRKKLREAGIKSLKCVCDNSNAQKTEGAVGSISYAPNMCGAVMAMHVITELICK